MIKRFARGIYLRIRFGVITEKVEVYTEWGVMEASYWARGKMVGYWAYGYFDPAYPYQG